MIRKLASAATLLVLMSPSAIASQTACTFTAGESPGYYELEFIGYGDTEPAIVFSSTAFGAGRPVALPSSNYSLKHFSPKAGKVNLEFRNPKNPALPPSFNLNGADGRAILTIGSNVIEGELKCDY
jgi:hypothetical protein